jgi:hypothetical protein
MRQRWVPRWAGAIAFALTAILPLAARPAAAGGAPCSGTAARVVGGYPLPAGIGEVSGLVASARYPGWGWMIRDSGHPADVYAVHFPGGNGPHEVRAIHVQGAVDVDWEDIAYQDGTLYVIESDQGRRARFIYEIPEPDPLGPSSTSLAARYAYAYPGGRRFNTEAAFFFAGHLVLVPKTTPAQLFRFDGPLSAARVNLPRFAGRLPGSNTASLAKVSPDNKTLVLANHVELFAYQVPAPATSLRQFTTRPVRRQGIAPGDNVEGGDFFSLGQCKLVLTAESKDVYRVFPPPAAGGARRPPRTGPNRSSW